MSDEKIPFDNNIGSNLNPSSQLNIYILPDKKELKKYVSSCYD